METKKTAKSYSPEVKERAVRMVLDDRGEHVSQWAAICSISARIGFSGEPYRTGCVGPNAMPGFGTA